MTVFSVFKIAADIDRFITSDMADLGHKPARSSIAIMLRRLDSTLVGNEVLSSFFRALKDPTLWHEANAVMLQSLTPLLKAVKLIAKDTDYEMVDRTVNNKDKTRLRDQITDVQDACYINGYQNASPILDYIFECRNLYVHSGVIPEAITYSDTNLGLAYCLTPFGYPLDNEGKYKSLCYLILATFAIYFDSLNPKLSKFSTLRLIGLTISMTVSGIVQSIAMGVMAVVLAIYTVVLSIRWIFRMGCFLYIALAILGAVCKIIESTSGNTATHKFTEVEPAQLAQWVDDASPYEQMSYLKDRRSSLHALRLDHKIGDAILSPADSATEALYETFKDYPDPSTSPFRHLLKSPGNLAKIPLYSAMINRPSDGKMFTDAPAADSLATAYKWLPIYQGEYYPVSHIYSADDARHTYALAQNITRHNKLDIAIIYSSDSKSADLAREYRKALIEIGVKSRRIKLVENPINGSGIIIAIKGISNYE